ncbi:hypothetical protein PPUJ20028_05130 [Pseudomonas putida]|uniref:Uncharacterized protein n=1 Tax=Pseudomonas putida TaxID=303 RepID=A0AA37VM72_PSEPU|nr:hypothetical protein [Pseudomonas putida]GLO11932.1 hypothetical protein PPUJ20028_05130 [Pseudomonas putida]GLO34096.1 hypothetical protein PPUN14671_09290 [Pseudomonas putida]HDS0965566.1 hypothetical protein [Pseudomonas putida]HDS0992267.1 hypothetical protein [Pseudomonas putida]
MGLWDRFKSAASSAINAVKKAAVATVNWLADKAETFVGNVKKVWKTVKPYISHVRVALTVLAQCSPWPIVTSMALALEKGLGFLENLDKHPMMEKLQKAIDWVIKTAREIRDKVLNDVEIAEAEARARTFKEAMDKVPAAELAAIRVAELINAYLLTKAKILRVVENEQFKDFNHYLRVRAAQKLLKFYEKRMTSIETLSDMDSDMLALMDISTSLLDENPTLTVEQTETLNELTTLHFGKPVVPFVFEEMTIAWNVELELLEEQWKQLNQSLSRDKVLAKRMAMASRTEALTAQEQVVLNDLERNLGRDSERLDNLDISIREKRAYVYASEGFLQLLEKDEQQLIDDGQEYLADRSEEVGALIARCAQQDVKWEALSEDEQALLIDFGNIFEDDCRARTESFKAVEVSL